MARFPVETSGEKNISKYYKILRNISLGVRCEEPKKHHKKKMSSLKTDQLKCKFFLFPTVYDFVGERLRIDGGGDGGVDGVGWRYRNTITNYCPTQARSLSCKITGER